MDIRKAIAHFWETRNTQLIKQKKLDQGNRGAVTGGKQMDGFVQILKNIALECGISEKHIFTRNNHLPGFFRPSKNWDFIIISPANKLIAVAELKSHVGSFGNNFNNRTEEAIGSATDIWTAFRENAFPNQSAPWLGFLIVVEKSEKSTKPVKIHEPHFAAFKDFQKSSYLIRYELLCKKLQLERLYNSTSLIWTSSIDKYGYSNEETSFDSFTSSLRGHLLGQKREFK